MGVWGLKVVCLTKGIKIGFLLRLDVGGQIVNILRQRIFGGWVVCLPGGLVVDAGRSLVDRQPGGRAGGAEFGGYLAHFLNWLFGLIQL